MTTNKVTPAEDWSYSDALIPFLTSNDVPKAADELLVQVEIARGEQQLSILDDKISELQQVLHSLQERCGQAEEFIYNHECIISALRRARLPPEILTEIFTYVADDEAVICDVTDGMWVLAQVCRYWRHILLSSPMLWSFMLIDTAALRVPSMVDEMLLRSQGAPTLCVNFSDDSYFDKEFNNFLATFINRTHLRWFYIDIKLCEEHLPVFSTVKGRIPLLQSLRIDGMPPPTFDCFLEAPSLEEFELLDSGSNDPQVSLSAIQIPWVQLRECMLPSSSLLDQSNVLQTCSNLDVLYIDGNFDPEDPQPSDMLTMPKLRQLLYDDGPHGLLNILVCPSLECIIVRMYDWADSADAPVQPFQQFLARSSIHLRELEFGRQCFSSDIPLHLLRQVPLLDLTTLIIQFDNMAPSYNDQINEIFKLLTIDPENPSSIILPCLKELRVTLGVGYLSDRITYLNKVFITLINMINSRWGSQTATKFARLELDVDVGALLPLAGALGPLLALREGGLELKVEDFYLFSCDTSASS